MSNFAAVSSPFHNYEHASHVCLSANKLLKRVVQPDDVYDRKGSTKTLASNLHQYTYGITSDPLTQVRMDEFCSFPAVTRYMT